MGVLASTFASQPPMLSAPKNNDTKNLVLAGLSGLGGVMLLAAFMGVRMLSIDLPFSVVGFSMVTGGLYGLGFFLVPKVLIDMNFSASVDKYHEFLARFS